MIKIISWDLQGTLSDADFSDEFWIELLPRLLIEKQMNINLSKFGKYDYRYYSTSYWLEKLNINFSKVLELLHNKPLFFKDTKKLLEKMNKKMIIVSSTTHNFINVELGNNNSFFSKIYSSLEDFNIPGKPAKLYKKIASLHNVKPSEILHIGDSYEMDITNAKKAGLKTFYFDRKQSRDEIVKELAEFLKNNC